MRNLAFLALLVFLTAACKKETVQETVTINSQNGLTFGNTAFAKVRTYDTIIENLRYGTGHIQLDIDDNGIMDMKLKNTFYSSMGGGSKFTVSLTVSNEDLEIATQEVSQPLFRSTKLEYRLDSTFNTWQRFVTQSHHCPAKSNLDTLVKTEKSWLPKPFYAQNMLDSTHTFANDTFLIKNRDYLQSFSQSPTNPNPGDTGVALYSIRSIDCDVLPLDEEIYVGLRFKSTNKLGWVKFSIDSKKLDIHVIETAVQE